MQLTHYIWIECLFIHYNDLTINWYNCSKCYVTVALLLKHSLMENYEQYYKSEATKDWVYSGVISFKMSVVGREKNPQNCISLLSVFVFPTVNVFLEGDRAGSWWKQFIFLDEADQEMEESLRAQRLRAAHNNVLWGPRPPHTECDFERTPSQNQCNGPEFLATALTASRFQAHQFISLYLPVAVLSFVSWVLKNDMKFLLLVQKWL